MEFSSGSGDKMANIALATTEQIMITKPLESLLINGIYVNAQLSAIATATQRATDFSFLA